MGIYGFLSAAYQETYSKLSVVENQKGFIQQKIDFYQKSLFSYGCFSVYALQKHVYITQISVEHTQFPSLPLLTEFK